MKQILIGSICLSSVPKELFKKVACKDGTERIYLNLAVIESKQVGKFGDTHFISVSPKEEERKEGVNYIVGNMKELKSQIPTQDEIQQTPPAAAEDLPF